MRARLTAPGTPARLASELIEAQGGFMLMEVVISSLLVGLIAVATFAGFDSAGRTRVDVRAHAQATVLAEQDEERLRGLTTTQLAQLGAAEPHYEAENGMCVEKVSTAWRYYAQENTSFCEKTSFAGTTYTGTVFTVTSSAEFVTAAKGKLTCEVSGGTADYIRSKSSVTWPSLGSRPPVTQSSIVSTPSSGGLLVKIENQAKEPVEGANVTAEGTALSATETTSAAGCAIFGALKAQTDKISVVKSNYVDVNGKNPPKSQEFKVAAGTLGELPFKIAPPGSIAATFESNGVEASGVSLVAYQANMTTAPKYFVEGLTTTTEPKHSLTVASLFPFAKPEKPYPAEKYTVYAGDCEKNKPSTVTAGVVPNPEAPVEPNVVNPVKVEVPAVTVNLYEGTEKEVVTEKKVKYVVPIIAMMINKECEGVVPVNSSTAVNYKHEVHLTALGHLETPYQSQPYAKAPEFCVVAPIGKFEYKYKKAFENKAKAGTTVNVYLKSATKGKTEKEVLTCP